MNRLLLLTALGVVCGLGAATPAAAQHGHGNTPWHGNYSYTQWGYPTALVVPPTARRQAEYSWGNPSAHTSPIVGRFRRSPDPMANGYNSGGWATPYWPSHTSQFGVYYVRAPRHY